MGSQVTDKAQLTLRELENAASSYHNLYNSFLQRHIAGMQQETFPLAEARLIAPASPPTRRNKPSPELILAFALLAGIGIGGGIGVVREAMDRVFRTSVQLQSHLQLPCLALVPLLKAGAPTKFNSVPIPIVAGQKRSARPSEQNILVHDSSIFWQILDAPLSRFAESVRAIKLATELDATSKRNQIIGFTSSLPNEGKSTISAALAQLTALTGRKILVVDCDLRNPSLSRSLAPNATLGIVDVVSGRQPLDDVLWRDPKTDLWFLPAVYNDSLHTAEVLGSDSMRRLFERLRVSFDVIIVDLSPLAPVLEVRAATHLVDCMILVVEWGRTKIDIVQQSLLLAPNVQQTIIGAVLNKTDMNQIGRYDIHGRRLYKNKYYARYGYSR